MKTELPTNNVSAREKALILKAVAEKYDGTLTSDLVVTESDPSNPDGIAHRLSCLVWSDDDATAARKYRQTLAREVIRSCEPELIQLGVFEIKAPYYVRDPRKGPSDPGYVPLMSIKSEREVAADTVRAETDRAVSALERAYSVAVALGLEEESATLYGALSVLGRAPGGVAIDASSTEPAIGRD